ncbi:unnamed protein product, partial [Didymodactylos carnosus]
RLYMKRPEPYHLRINDLVDLIFADNGQYLATVSYLLCIITKEHSEIINDQHVDKLFNRMKDGSENDISYLYIPLNYVAGTQPNLFLKHIDILIQMTKEKQNVPAFYCLSQFLTAQAIYSEKQADESARIFTGLLDKSTSDMRPTIFHCCQLIGIRYKQILKPYKHIFIKYEKESSCQILIDFIDGKSGDEYADVMKNAQIEMA